MGEEHEEDAGASARGTARKRRASGGSESFERGPRNNNLLEAYGGATGSVRATRNGEHLSRFEATWLFAWSFRQISADEFYNADAKLARKQAWAWVVRSSEHFSGSNSDWWKTMHSMLRPRATLLCSIWKADFTTSHVAERTGAAFNIQRAGAAGKDTLYLWRVWEHQLEGPLPAVVQNTEECDKQARRLQEQALWKAGVHSMLARGDRAGVRDEMIKHSAGRKNTNVVNALTCTYYGGEAGAATPRGIGSHHQVAGEQIAVPAHAHAPSDFEAWCEEHKFLPLPPPAEVKLGACPASPIAGGRPPSPVAQARKPRGARQARKPRDHGNPGL